MKPTLVRAIALSAAVCLVSLGAGAVESSSAARGPRMSFGSIEILPNASLAIDGGIRIVATFRTAGKGTFKITGMVSDAGALTATRRVSRGRQQVTQTLVGKAGVIRIRSTRPCEGSSGTWRVLSGSKAYAGLSGGGAASGGPRCISPKYPAVAVYKGTVRVPPPPPLAQPGRFGGGTSQREEVILDVLEGGRMLAAFRLRVTTRCEGTTTTQVVIVNLPGPYELGPDGSFSLPAPANQWKGGVVGRFTSPTTAAGTATVTTSFTVTSTNTTYTCSAEVPWSASLPPPAATPGRYCGSTNQNQARSICLDVTASGREVARVDVGIVALCNGRRVEVEVRMVLANIPIGGNLGFAKSSSSLEGFVSGTGRVSGLFDPNGGTGAHGSVSLLFPVFDYEGTRYSCGAATAQWEARRQ